MAVVMHCLLSLSLSSIIINVVVKFTVLFLDANKAFDKVLINGLIVKLIKKGALFFLYAFKAPL